MSANIVDFAAYRTRRQRAEHSYENGFARSFEEGYALGMAEVMHAFALGTVFGGALFLLVWFAACWARA